MAPVPQQAYTQHTSGMTSTSEDEEDSMHKVQEVPRQTVKGMKKKHRTSKDSTNQVTPLDNKYQVSTDPRNDEANSGAAELKAAKPSPMFVYGVTNLPEMQKRLNELLDEEQYTTKKNGK
jgi:hypothetical protein